MKQHTAYINHALWRPSLRSCGRKPEYPDETNLSDMLNLEYLPCQDKQRIQTKT